MDTVYGMQAERMNPSDEFDPNGGDVIAAEEGTNDTGESDRLLIGAIHAAEQTAYGGDGDSGLSTERARSIDDYLGKPYGNEVEGRSQVISRDVYDTVEWIKPSLLRIFTSGDDVAKFEPEGPEDEAGAQQESEYINYVVQEKNPWFPVCNEWFTDALLTKNAYALAYYDTTKTVESERYSGLTDEQFTLLMQDEGIEVVEHSARPDEAQQGMLHDVVIRRTKETRGVKICVLPPERCMVSENVSGMSVRDADYFGYWELKTVSDIRKMGFDIADEIADDYRELNNEEEEARDQYEENSHRSLSGENDPSMRRVSLRMSWIKFDYDGDGIAERRYVLHIGDTILHNEECQHVPVACIVPTPLPHRHPGLSVRDMVTDLQEIKTAIWRQALDNLYLANNGRTAVSDKVNMSDMLVSRPGGVVRVNGVPANEIMPFTHPLTMAPALQMMDYTDRIRESRTGTSQAFTGVDANVLAKSHSGVAISQLTSSAAQRVEMIARVFSDGVKELLLIVHGLCIKHGHKAEVIKLRNKWVTVDPSQWKKRYDMKLSVGLGTGNKEQLMANLMTILHAQKEAIQIGITEPRKIYNALTELTKAAGFASPDRFWTEPPEGPPQPQPDPNKMALDAQVAIEQAKQQEETKRTQMEIESKERIAQAQIDKELQLASMKDDTGRLDGYEVRDDNGKLVIAKREMIEAEEMNKQEMQAVFQMMAQATQTLTQAAQMLAQSAQMIAAPKRKVPTRDKSGRITHVDEIPIQIQ